MTNIKDFVERDKQLTAGDESSKLWMVREPWIPVFPGPRGFYDILLLDLIASNPLELALLCDIHSTLEVRWIAVSKDPYTLSSSGYTSSSSFLFFKYFFLWGRGLSNTHLSAIIIWGRKFFPFSTITQSKHAFKDFEVGF